MFLPQPSQQECVQKCSFHVDYKVDTIDREFGTVIIERDGGQMDLSMEVVKAGWAKVCTHWSSAVHIINSLNRYLQASEAVMADRTCCPHLLSTVHTHLAR